MFLVGYFGGDASGKITIDALSDVKRCDLP
jgi:hypothetical protein